MAALENANPLVYEKAKERERTADEDDDDVVDPIDDREVFDILWLYSTVARSVGLLRLLAHCHYYSITID